jgi:hypothetical protein
VRDNLLPLGERDPNLAWGCCWPRWCSRCARRSRAAKRAGCTRWSRCARPNSINWSSNCSPCRKTSAGAWPSTYDGLTQLIVSAHLHLEALSSMADPASPQARAALAKGLARTKSAIEEARRVTSALRPSTLDDLGLVAALHRTAQELDTDGQWELEFEDGLRGARLDPVVESTVFRIARALTNVKKYAQARRCASRSRATRRTCTRAIGARGSPERFAPAAGANGWG